MYVYQTDKNCYSVIQKIGCYFRSCLHIAELETGKQFTAEQINLLWDKANHNDFIIDDLLKKPGQLIEMGCKVLGKNVDAFDVGSFQYGVIHYYDWVKTHPQYKKYKYLIQKIQTANGHEHYRVVSRFGEVLFDPYNPAPSIEFIYFSILFYVA